MVLFCLRVHHSMPRFLRLYFDLKKFRPSALGYFGHMWKLYTLLAFILLFLLGYSTQSNEPINISLWFFITIAVDFIECADGGFTYVKLGSTKVASTQLLISGACCILRPFLFRLNGLYLCCLC
jgi:hypothetical protein